LDIAFSIQSHTLAQNNYNKVIKKGRIFCAPSLFSF